jgi:X-Pro dipeptidyl-peptidase
MSQPTRRRRGRPFAVSLLTAATVLAFAPATSADDADDPPFTTTDPSAELAPGALGDLAPPSDDPGARSLRTTATEPDEIVVTDGVTQPVFSYEDAVRETVIVPGAVASEDANDLDQIMVDIIRPAASDGDLDVPTIIVPSPYYAGPGRGRAGETKPSVNPVPTLSVDGTDYTMNLLTGSIAVSGETGPLVDCGLALSVDDCPEGTEGAIAVIERGEDTFAAKASNAAAAGAVAAVIYNNAAGGFTGNLGAGIPIPAVALNRADGLALVAAIADGDPVGTLANVRPPLDRFPLYYDNYFVPRGYAVALVDAAGTRGSTGCLDIGGPAEIENTAKVVEWLAGDHEAFDLDGNAVDAHWSTGVSGMVGKSWDGSIANGVAATGVDGLATIVPIEGISSWYDWFWMNGARYSINTPLNLARSNRTVPQSRCTQIDAVLAAEGPQGDPASEFWTERDYRKDAANVKASVFFVHGLNDYNVKPKNYGDFWEALAEHDVPRKIWLSQVAHEKAFDFRRDEWIDTIHRWFDHWLQELDNGIMDEPVADVEYAPNQWASYDRWPGGTMTTLLPGQPDDASDPRPGTLKLTRRNLQPASQTFRETRQSRDNAAINGFTQRDDRLVFMTEELRRPLRVSGAPEVSLRASIDGSNASFSAYLVDYGTTERTNWNTQGGILDLTSLSCFGQGTAADTGCYRDVQRRTWTRDFEVVARGWANAQFVSGQSTFDPDRTYTIEWDVHHTDYEFRAGHRLGVVITGVDSTAVAVTGTSSDVEVMLNGTRIRLPIVGGARAFKEATEPPPGRAR